MRDEEFPDSVLALEHPYQLNFNVEPQRKKLIQLEAWIKSLSLNFFIYKLGLMTIGGIMK